mgnify:CR=1 FL=1
MGDYLKLVVALVNVDRWQCRFLMRGRREVDTAQSPDRVTNRVIERDRIDCGDIGIYNDGGRFRFYPETGAARRTPKLV